MDTDVENDCSRVPWRERHRENAHAQADVARQPTRPKCFKNTTRHLTAVPGREKNGEGRLAARSAQLDTETGPSSQRTRRARVQAVSACRK